MGFAVGAETFHHVVDRGHAESLGQGDLGDSCVAEAEGAVAAFAVEVDVLVVVMVMVVALAYFVAHGSASVLDVVDEVVVEQEGKCTEDGASLGGGHAFLEFAQGEWPPRPLEFLVDEQAHGCWLHAPVFKSFLGAHVGVST